MPGGNRLWLLFFPVVVAILVFVLYYPGLSGPYTLDDNSNLLSNTAVQITELSGDSLKNAAFSVKSGPTYRPVSLVTFALNYYFAGSFDDSTPYKITNLIIHIINAGLVFWLLYLLTTRLASNTESRSVESSGSISPVIFSGIVALAWAIHPIQLTSVLYVIQRMSALSGTFVLLALIVYAIGRNRIIEGKKFGLISAIVISPIIGLIGVFAKENAALLPVYILAIEATIYRRDLPWRKWGTLQKRTKYLVLLASILAVVLLIFWAIAYSLPQYSPQSFTMPERLMTEARVLLFYVSLILVPRINRFGLHHDDIALSQSLIDPWTTSLSIVLITVALISAWYYRERAPLFSLGVFIFFAAHILESTVFPLGIAYEHRNYIALLGVLIAAGQGLILLSRHINYRITLGSISIFLILASMTTYIRATHWQTDQKLYAHEALHHPNSAIANFELAGLLESRGNTNQAVKAAHRAVLLDPNNIAFRIFLALLQSRNGIPPDYENTNTANELMKVRLIQPITYLLLHKVIGCLDNECSSLMPVAEDWMTTLISVNKQHYLQHEFNHMYGVIQFNKNNWGAAEVAMRRAIELKPDYVSAYLDLSSVYLATGETGKAIEIFTRLLTVDPDNSSRYRSKIDALSPN